MQSKKEERVEVIKKRAVEKGEGWCTTVAGRGWEKKKKLSIEIKGGTLVEIERFKRVEREMRKISGREAAREVKRESEKEGEIIV